MSRLARHDRLCIGVIKLVWLRLSPTARKWLASELVRQEWG